MDDRDGCLCVCKHDVYMNQSAYAIRVTHTVWFVKCKRCCTHAFLHIYG
jgi:hypothetical protein